MTPTDAIARRAAVVRAKANATSTNPKITELIQKSIAVPTPLLMTKIVTKETPKTNAQAKTVELAQGRIVTLQKNIVSLEELNATQRIKHHKRALAAAKQNNDYKERLKIAEESLLHKSTKIVELTAGLLEATTELEELKDQVDDQADSLGLKKVEIKDLRKKVSRLTERIAKLEDELQNAKDRVGNLEKYIRLLKDFEKDTEALELQTESVAWPMMLFGGAVSLLGGPFLSTQIGAEIAIRIHADPEVDRLSKSVKEIKRQIDELEADLDFI